MIIKEIGIYPHKYFTLNNILGGINMIQYEVLFDDDDYIYLKEFNNNEIINQKILKGEFNNYKKNKIEM